MVRLLNQYVSVKGILLFIFEAILIFCTLIVALRLRFWGAPSDFTNYFSAPQFPWQAITVILGFQTCFLYGNLYAPEALESRSQLLLCLGQSLGGGCILLAITYFVFPQLLLGRGVFLISTALVAVLIVTTRLLLNGAWGVAVAPHKTLILGTGELAAEAARELRSRPDLGVQLSGFIQAAYDPNDPIAVKGPILGSMDDLEDLTFKKGATRIVVALQDRRGTLPVRRLLRLRGEGIRIEDAHSLIASLTGRVSLKTIQPSWFIFSDGFRRSPITMALKRGMDLILLAIGFVLMLPVMALIALAIRLDSKGPIFYRQTRVGLKGKQFQVLKFRSMRIDAEKDGGPKWASANDPRTTRLGRYLRKFRLDELPQFINVLRGEMSFVGPRPERPEFVIELREVIPFYDERHLVRPGLTGWAQVQYSYGAGIEGAFCKLEYDLFYLKNMSPILDFLILAKTLRIVSTGHGSR